MLLPLADMFNHSSDSADFLLSGPSTATDNIRQGFRIPQSFGLSPEQVAVLKMLISLLDDVVGVIVAGWQVGRR